MSGISTSLLGGTARGGQVADREAPSHLSRDRSNAPAFGSLLAGKLGARRDATAPTAPTAPVATDVEDGGALTTGAIRDALGATGSINVGEEALGDTSAAPEALPGDNQAAALLTAEPGRIHASLQASIQATADGNDAPADASSTDDSEQGAEGAPTIGGAERAASPATIEVAASAPAAAANAPYRGMDGMVSELRDRLQRVMERMREEHGVQVSVVETYRPQARQDALHAQGRSAPGQVVTWTRNSRHTQGRAVDVMVNGGYTDARAFATLQQVAREEGLHTLGMRDPGHLELPSAAPNGTKSGNVDLAALTRLATEAGATVDQIEISPRAQDVAQVSRPEQIARPARVAQVAAVASVATVATVARVATVGARAVRASASTVAGAAATESATAVTASATTSNAVAGGPIAATGRAGDAPGAVGADTASGRPGAAVGDAVTTNVAAGTGGQRAGGGFAPPRDGDRKRQDAEATSAAAGRGDTGEGTLFVGGEGGRDQGGQHASARATPVAASNATDSLARLDRIDQLRDGSAARPLSHLTLSLDNAAGGADRIRVGLRGNQVGAVLELSDSALHDRVSSRLGELQGALEQRGLEADSLRVRRSGATAAETLDIGRVASAAMDRAGARGAAHNGANPGGDQQPTQQYTSQREREGRPHRDPATHDQTDRHNPRRQPKEDPR